jgi:signal transduction histidine kinase
MSHETIQSLKKANAALKAEIAAYRQEHETLRQSTAELRLLLVRLYQMQEEERSRLARQLHNQTGQALTGLKMDIVWLQNCLTREEPAVAEKVQRMGNLVDEAIHSLRRTMGELRPAILDDLGLVAAVEWQLHEFQTRTGIYYQIDDASDDPELDPAVSIMVFRIFRELLDNVYRHAQASRVEVEIYPDADQLIVQVKDNGRGLTRTEIESNHSLGLRNMQEEASLIGAQVTFHGIEKRGTIVTIRLPLPVTSAIPALQEV